ncbi:VOC family protein [Bacillus sp. DTU_2020_1000418_1_SI_GHA_SEK_038]|uniref:VOC family protein n=1 Tax=Bacillus sp. DTU_2020_1000418_1_SI_GHA_SEK_038 TaxID=3077585 RepID=UPI0028E75997|nr:VOC family protein [Bacillus sp. DTU_2020_1000418_1_SI_GHA_SEK_038]WNS74973.1 VOC family protein [Bacillus sp. DTU_2020_1000418_1_SI_GHA_SEK_038]
MKWHHGGIQVRNLEEAIEFYETVFDFKIEQYLTLLGEKIAFLIKGEVRIELIESEEAPVPISTIHLSWQVEDVEEWVKKLSVNGLELSEGPYKLKNGWDVVFYEGLNNEVIELIQVGEGNK